MKHFFRGNPSDFSFKIFGQIHILFIFIAVMGIIYLVKNRNELKDNKAVKNIIIYTLLLQQVLLYMWYGTSGYFSLQESLPFYNCRLAILSLVLGDIFKNDRLKYLGMYWGLMGSILALLVPVLDPFGFDHFTFYSFFIGHLFLLWGSFYLILVEEKNVDSKTLRGICRFTNIYHTMIFLFDKRVGANYCYLIESPVMGEMIDRIPQLIYTLAVILLFDLIIYITHLGIVNIIDKTRGNYIDEVDIDKGVLL